MQIHSHFEVWFTVEIVPPCEWVVAKVVRPIPRADVGFLWTPDKDCIASMTASS